jgi:hypothetical protein
MVAYSFPLTHQLVTGLKATYAMSDTAATVGVNRLETK